MKFLSSVIFLLALNSFVSSLDLCNRTPRWTLSSKRFPADFAKSQIKVLAFLKASCGFCQTQLARLIDLQNDFNKKNNINVAIIVINSFDADSFKNKQIFADINNNRTVSILQDTNIFNIWDLYRAETDDMLVFDKCGRMTAHLQLPDSVVTNGKLNNEIWSAYSNSICSTATCRKKSLSIRNE